MQPDEKITRSGQKLQSFSAFHRLHVDIVRDCVMEVWISKILMSLLMIVLQKQDRTRGDWCGGERTDVSARRAPVSQKPKRGQSLPPQVWVVVEGICQLCYCWSEEKCSYSPGFSWFHSCIMWNTHPTIKIHIISILQFHLYIWNVFLLRD